MGSRCRSVMILASCVVLLTGCTPSQAPPDGGQPVRDRAADELAVREAHQALIEAYEEGSIDGFTWLLSSSPEVVIFHPRLKARYAGGDQAKRGLLAMFGRMKGVSWTEVHTSLSLVGDVAWVTSDVLIEAPGLGEPFLGRGTEIWVREDVGWRLVHGHWSPTPGAIGT